MLMQARAVCSSSANISTLSRSRTTRQSSSAARSASRTGGSTRDRIGRFDRNRTLAGRDGFPHLQHREESTMTWKRICDAAELAENAVKKFDVDGIPIVVVND